MEETLQLTRKWCKGQPSRRGGITRAEVKAGTGAFELPFEGRKESGWSISEEDAGVIKVLRVLGRGPGRWGLVYQGQYSINGHGFE